MKKLTPENFFSLDQFEHRRLFEKSHFVWDAIKLLLSYLETLSLGEIRSQIPEGVFLQNREMIFIDTDCQIDPGVLIVGPCYIGSNTIVRHGATIRGGVITGNNCVIGHATEIKHSILLNGAKAAHFNYVGDSILGCNVNLGAGVKCANVRLDKQPISIKIDGEIISTELTKLGAIIGDGSNLGCNGVCNPGSLLEKGVSTLPNTCFGGYIKSASPLKKNQR